MLNIMHDLSRLAGDYFSFFWSQRLLGKDEPEEDEKSPVINQIKELDTSEIREVYNILSRLIENWKARGYREARTAVLIDSINYFEKRYLNPQKTG